jgi:cytochrome c peroxidase
MSLGAYDTLEEVVRHHIDPEGSLRNYNRANFIAPHGDDLDEVAKANELKKNRRIKERDTLAFLNALTDMDSVDLRHYIPSSVPSGLPVFD